jgi:hypothetical protein
MGTNNKEIWEQYTLLDFLKILSNESNTPLIKDEYFKFVGSINRFNKLLSHMYCLECGFLLRPLRESNYAFYRTVRFHCENSNCSKSDKNHKENEIYLHHCMNGHCDEIIDSRFSKQCPNGLYICSNEYCGCCCSNEMFNRVLNNLKSTGGSINQKLSTAVKEHLGHLEKFEHFCYRCGNLMIKTSTNIFKCESCKIEYDLDKDNIGKSRLHSSNPFHKQQHILTIQNDHADLPF